MKLKLICPELNSNWSRIFFWKITYHWKEAGSRENSMHYHQLSTNRLKFNCKMA